MRMNKKKAIVPKLRFPEYIGSELRITKLGKISSVVKEKAGEKKYTLMSVTSGVGLVPQSEKFGREIAGDSYKNYIVIKKYDFAYNKSSTKQFLHALGLPIVNHILLFLLISSAITITDIG